MKKCLFGIISSLLLILSNQAHAQDEFFHEIVIEKVLHENEEWEFVGEANFKNLYDEHSWRRWGTRFFAIRKSNHFNYFGGINTFYTFNRSITNFFEIRPWTAIQYNMPLVRDFNLRQRLQYEWRIFQTDENNVSRENYTRLRYQIGVDIPIPIDSEPKWSIRPFFEWFIIRDPATFERFPNERDYGITISRRLNEEHELFFTYRLEEFFNTTTKRGNGHIFLIGYSF